MCKIYHPAFRDAISKDPSPLVRGAAVQALGLVPTAESLQVLVEATADEYRLVRVRAAAGIAAFPRMTVPPGYREQLKKALRADPQRAPAAYNLCILMSKDRIGEAVTRCRKAAESAPQNPAYAYTLAFYLNEKGDKDETVKTMEALLAKNPGLPRCRVVAQGTVQMNASKVLSPTVTRAFLSLRDCAMLRAGRRVDRRRGCVEIQRPHPEGDGESSIRKGFSSGCMG